MGPDVMFIIFFVLLLLLFFFFLGGGGGGGGGGGAIDFSGKEAGGGGFVGADIHSNSKVSVTRENREFKLHVYGKRQVENFSKLKMSR